MICRRFVLSRCLLPALILACPLSTFAQSEGKPPSPEKVGGHNTDPLQTFYLKNAAQPNDANEILTAIRLMTDPVNKVFLVPSENAIVARGPADQLRLVQKILDDIDRPKRNFRLTYTITEMDGARRIGLQRFTLTLASGGRTTLKSGSKIPVATGTFNSANSSAQTQFTYLDVGMNFDASILESANLITLKSKVEQSSLGEDKSIAGIQEPVVRQTVEEGSYVLTLGKPLVLGSLDLPGSTRHVDIEAVVDLAR